MSELMKEFERSQRRRRRVVWLVVLACLSGFGAWLTGPVGVITVLRGNPVGYSLVAPGVVLLAVSVFAIVSAMRLREAPQTTPGRPNPHFDEPQPSQDPRGGNSWIGSWMGSR
ncbi:hypothetical protein [Leifsonia sp. AG29]|uniref:hypothetical protein n=1 Tax=Leifsonia sp. AG29 TaxID=2598860 RepID=UPI00131BE532|nr:hypothetical protein [Leifsonia sp. AG29]